MVIYGLIVKFHAFRMYFVWMFGTKQFLTFEALVVRLVALKIGVCAVKISKADFLENITSIVIMYKTFVFWLYKTQSVFRE